MTVVRVESVILVDIDTHLMQLNLFETIVSLLFVVHVENLHT